MNTKGHIRSQQQRLSIISSNLFSLPPMTSISSHLSLFLIFSVLSLILSPFIFLSPSSSHFFLVFSPSFLSSLFFVFILLSRQLTFIFALFLSPKSVLPRLLSCPFSLLSSSPASTLSVLFTFLSPPTSTLPPCQ